MFRRLVFAAASSVVVVSLVGCASGPAPNYIAGNYYMGGDDRCALYRMGDGSFINCYTKAGVFTETRYPMTESQMRMYQAVAAQKSAEADAFLAQSNAAAAQFNQSAQQTLQRSYQYQAPVVNTFGQPSSTVRCITAGIYTNCRN